MVKKSNFTRDNVSAARSVLIELFQVLEKFREQIVLIGGWVPEFIFSHHKFPYVGSMDVDIALDQWLLLEQKKGNIRELLIKYGYEEDEQPNIMWRQVRIRDREIRVRIDLLPLDSRLVNKKNSRLNKSDSELFRDLAQTKTIAGKFPNGKEGSVAIRIVSIGLFLALKGAAFHDRLKTKDAWDIYYCLLNFPRELKDLANEIRPSMQNKLIREGFQKIADLFSSVDDYGPKFVADFDEIDDRQEREMRMRDAFERVQTLLKELGIIQSTA